MGAYRQGLFSVTSRNLPNFGVYGIDIFFVISGFIMSMVVLNSATKPGLDAAWAFTKRRVIRIYPIFWVFELLTTARLLHGHQLFRQNYFPSFLLLPNALYPRMIAFSWTLMFEILFYMTMAAILLVTVRRAVEVVIALLCASATIGIIVGLHLSAWSVVGNPILIEIVFGAGIALAYRRFGARRPFGIALVCIGTALSFYLRAYPPNCAPGPSEILDGRGVLLRIFTWGIAAAAVVGGTVFWSPSIQSRVGKMCVVIGNASYSIYLASALVIEFTLRLFLKFPTGHPLSLGFEIGYQAAIVAVVLAAGWICYQFVEWPLVRWLQARSGTKPRTR